MRSALRCALALMLLVCGLAAQSAAQQPSRPVSQSDPLIELVERAVRVTSYRTLDVDKNSPWQIVHGFLALRQDFIIKVGEEEISALKYISEGATFNGEHWFEKTPHGGRAHPFTVPYAFEGHVNQFPALMCLANIPYEHEFQVAGGETIRMNDILRNAQLTANTREEMTWTLWLLAFYLEPDAQWYSADGQFWSIEHLVSLETRKPVVGAPCGGTHRLFALALARNGYLQQNPRLRGVWLAADQKIQQHIHIAKALQNRDGSMSTGFFKEAGHSTDVTERLKTSGHMLEWLMMALPQRDLSAPWVRRAIESLANDLIRSASEPAECGPLYHSQHALILYLDRVSPESLQVVRRQPRQAPGSDISSSIAGPESEPGKLPLEQDPLTAPRKLTTNPLAGQSLPDLPPPTAQTTPLPPEEPIAASGDTATGDTATADTATADTATADTDTKPSGGNSQLDLPPLPPLPAPSRTASGEGPALTR